MTNFSHQWSQDQAHSQSFRSRTVPCYLCLLVVILQLVRVQLLSTPLNRLQAPGTRLVPLHGAGAVDRFALELTAESRVQPPATEDWWLAQIGAPVAWQSLQDTRRAVVAVVDSGIDTRHPDLAGQLWVNPNEVPGNGRDDDGNGYVDDVHGWNMVDGNADLSDNTGHGTAMAGIIAAARDGQGMTGVCPACRLMVVKVTGTDGRAAYPELAAGIAYAVQNGAGVINVSLGGQVNAAALWRAVTAASHEAVVVSGAGNDGRALRVYPGAYDPVLTVAAVDADGTKLEDSNFGDWVDVVAPGSSILTCRMGGGYDAKSGTSAASAVAAGLAGLLLCQHADWPPEKVRAQIILTAGRLEETDPALEGQLGSGRINAERAFAAPLLARSLP